MGLCSAFNKFMMRNPNVNPAYVEKMKEMRRKNNKSTIDHHSEGVRLPRIQRFHSFVRP